jgi:hypothetical protein
LSSRGLVEAREKTKKKKKQRRRMKRRSQHKPHKYSTVQY